MLDSYNAATIANFTCLAATRHAVLAQAGWDVEADGFFGALEVAVVVGEEAHPTLFKSLGLAGFGRSRVVRVPVGEQGRMRADMFPHLSGPTIVCLCAGNVNTGDSTARSKSSQSRKQRMPGCMSMALLGCGQL